MVVLFCFFKKLIVKVSLSISETREVEKPVEGAVKGAKNWINSLYLFSLQKTLRHSAGLKDSDQGT